MHISEIQISLLLEKKLSYKEQQEVNLHIADCPLCAEKLASSYKLYNSFESLKVPKELHIRTTTKIYEEVSRLLNRVTLKYALAGVVLILSLVTFYTVFEDEPEVSKFRSIDSEHFLEIFEPTDESVLKGSNILFRWSSVEGSIAYRFFIYEEDGKNLTSTLLTDTSYSLSNLQLKPGNKYLWRIEIIFPDETKHRSEINAFTYTK